MYTPAHFDETRIDVLHELIRAFPLATIVTLTGDGLEANHIPLSLADTGGGFGVLRGHVARPNGLWKTFVAEVDALAIFSGPETYISPSWYPTKRESGKVVPTWNYASVHARGPLRIVDDPAWILAQMIALTNQQESAFREPWAVSDAPADYVEKLLGAVVGIEIPIAQLSGKWKMSQNQPERNRDGVIDALTAQGSEVAALVARRGANG